MTLQAARPWFPEEDLPGLLEEIADVLRGGRLILGPRARRLEEQWAQRCGTRHAIAVSSCTAALEIVYRHLRVSGREVIVPTNTFVATAIAANDAGAKVVFADVDARDYCVSVDDVLAKMGSATAAVVVVHVAGFVPHGFERLVETCRERGVKLVEDCAHAHGARTGGRAVGGFGHAGCWSFYPTKILTCGVGGMITTDDDDLDAFARSLRHHGQGASLEEIVRSGNDWVMDEIRAAVCLSQVARLDDFLARRRAVAARYDALLASRPHLERAVAAPGVEPAYYKYPVLLPAGTDRTALRTALHDRHGMEFGALYSPPAHQMPVFRPLEPPALPVAEALLPRQTTLPLHAAMTPDDAERAVVALDAVLGR